MSRYRHAVLASLSHLPLFIKNQGHDTGPTGTVGSSMQGRRGRVCLGAPLQRNQRTYGRCQNWDNKSNTVSWPKLHLVPQLSNTATARVSARGRGVDAHDQHLPRPITPSMHSMLEVTRKSCTSKFTEPHIVTQLTWTAGWK